MAFPVENKNKDLCVIPFNLFDAITYGGATATKYNSLSGNGYTNGSAITVSMPIGKTDFSLGSDGFIQLSLQFYGKIAGIYSIASSLKHVYTVVIDGVAYKAGFDEYKYKVPLLSNSESTLYDRFYTEIIADNLTDELHNMEIIMQANAVSSYYRTLVGLVVSKGAGYKQEEARSYLITSFEIDETSKSILSILPDTNIISVSKFLFYNPTNSTVNVIITNLYSLVIKTLEIAAGKSAEIDFNSGINLDTSLFNIYATPPFVNVTATIATMTSGSSTLVVNSTTGLQIGMKADATGIPASTYILRIVDATTIILSANCTADASSGTVTFSAKVLTHIFGRN